MYEMMDVLYCTMLKRNPLVRPQDLLRQRIVGFTLMNIHRSPASTFTLRASVGEVIRDQQLRRGIRQIGLLE